MQTITMRETGEVFNIEDMVYPLPELGIIYLRMVVVDCEEASDNMKQAHMEMMEAAVAEEELVEEVKEDTEHHAFYG